MGKEKRYVIRKRVTGLTGKHTDFYYQGLQSAIFGKEIVHTCNIKDAKIFTDRKQALKERPAFTWQAVLFTNAKQKK